MMREYAVFGFFTVTDKVVAVGYLNHLNIKSFTLSNIVMDSAKKKKSIFT